MSSASSALGAFASRQRAAEGRWFAGEGQSALMRHLEKLVEQGKVEAAALDAARRAQEASAASGLPTEVVNRRREWVYEHKPGLLPAPRWDDKRYVQLGTKVSLGRARWAIEDASIFSVADGKRLASEPPPQASFYEQLRMNKIHRATHETPTMAGLRLLPKFTPGRAFFWGTVLALWGTGAVVATTARQLDIHTAEEAPSRLRALFAPVAAALEARLAPLRGSLSVTAAAGEAVREETRQSELVRRLRSSML